MLIFFVGLKKKGTFIPPHGGYPTTRDHHFLQALTRAGGKVDIPFHAFTNKVMFFH